MNDLKYCEIKLKEAHPRDPLVKKIVALLVPRGEMGIFTKAKEHSAWDSLLI